MARVRLTDETVGSMRPGGRLCVLWDIDLWGFGCVVPPCGRPAYFAYYRTPVSGVRCRRTIGTHGALTCAQARAMAQNLIGRSAPQQLHRPVAKP